MSQVLSLFKSDHLTSSLLFLSFIVFFPLIIFIDIFISSRSAGVADSFRRRRFAEEEVDCYLSGADGRNDCLFGF